jgi:hypothetical protein
LSSFNLAFITWLLLALRRERPLLDLGVRLLGLRRRARPVPVLRRLPVQALRRRAAERRLALRRPRVRRRPEPVLQPLRRPRPAAPQGATWPGPADCSYK